MNLKKLNEELKKLFVSESETIFNEFKELPPEPILIPIEPTEQEKQDDALVRDLFKWSQKIEGKDFKWHVWEENSGLNCSMERKYIGKYGEPCISAFLRLDLPSRYFSKNYIEVGLGLDRYAPRDKELSTELKNTFIYTKEDLQNLGFTEIREARSGGEDWITGYIYFDSVEECISKWKELLPIIIKGKQ